MNITIHLAGPGAHHAVTLARVLLLLIWVNWDWQSTYFCVIRITVSSYDFPALAHKQKNSDQNIVLNIFFQRIVLLRQHNHQAISTNPNSIRWYCLMSVVIFVSLSIQNSVIAIKRCIKYINILSHTAAKIKGGFMGRWVVEMHSSPPFGEPKTWNCCEYVARNKGKNFGQVPQYNFWLLALLVFLV